MDVLKQVGTLIHNLRACVVGNKSRAAHTCGIFKSFFSVFGAGKCVNVWFHKLGLRSPNLYHTYQFVLRGLEHKANACVRLALFVRVHKTS